MTPEGKSTIDLLISQPATGVWISQEICEVNWPRLSSISCHQTWSDAFCWWSLGSTGGRFRGTLRGEKNRKWWNMGADPHFMFFFDDPQSFPSFLPSRARSMATMTTGFVVVPGVEMLATTLALDKCSDLTAAHQGWKTWFNHYVTMGNGESRKDGAEWFLVAGFVHVFLIFTWNGMKWDDDPHDKQMLTGCEATSRGIYRGFIGL